eukprot:1159170-Pelagomonas_calceolata.AAC.7
MYRGRHHRSCTVVHMLGTASYLEVEDFQKLSLDDPVVILQWESWSAGHSSCSCWELVMYLHLPDARGSKLAPA